ncbi:MAG: Na/Pi cotransporter family protein [Oscillospiraceae bacterium]|nr:Na/Pi cotransporter family protein [Oscillospiraceae bacterium]
MDIFDILTMIGGLCLFLFGMNIMGEALERRAGSSLRTLLGKLTSNKAAGFLTGLGVTAVIQSSSATTVMVVGFVNSGLLTLAQAINVIMGANVGTTVTSWILSLGGIEGSNLFVQLLKPTSFTPVLALIGIIFYMFLKSSKKKDTGMILLGFATLMFGMDAMSGAVEGLKDVPQFQQLFLLFTNPILGVLAGAVLTAIIQSSSASVGILQALSSTGQVSYAAAIPIIMGQNIGTCITAILSSVGTTKNARRAAFVHLLFNILGTVACLIIFVLVDLLLAPAILSESATHFGIAVCHTIFNIVCTALLLPCSKLLEKLVCKLVPDTDEEEKPAELDENLMAVPAVALEQCRKVTGDMAEATKKTYLQGVQILSGYTPELETAIRKGEKLTDHYEDILGSYLVKLSSLELSEDDHMEAAALLKAIGDLERIGDHCRNMMESAKEMFDKKAVFTESAKKEIAVLTGAVSEIIDISFRAFLENDLPLARQVEPLEEVIDDLKDALRSSHVLRLQQGSCSIETGFVWLDLLTGLERISDHCANLAGAVIDLSHHNRNIHETNHALKKENPDFAAQFDAYQEKYKL